MSLINEALKKAQRQRTEERAELLAPLPGGGQRVVRRANPMSTQTIVLLAGGGVALFVVCVVVAVIWINQPTPAKPIALKAAVAKASGESASPAPVIVAPVTGAKPIEPNLTVTAASVPVVRPAPPVTPPDNAISISSARAAPSSELATSSRTETASPAARELAPAPARTVDPVIVAPILPNAGKFDERIQAVVDTWRVAGIRSSGNESKVLLNERVYRINDVVDRANGLRLIKVAKDSLTFTTPDGVTYVKNF